MKKIKIAWRVKWKVWFLLKFNNGLNVNEFSFPRVRSLDLPGIDMPSRDFIKPNKVCHTAIRPKVTKVTKNLTCERAHVWIKHASDEEE